MSYKENRKIDSLLIKLGACSLSRDFAKGKSFKEIYETCNNGEWLIWLFKEINPESVRELMSVKVSCLELIEYDLTPDGLRAFNSANSYVNGHIGLKSLNKASRDVFDSIKLDALNKDYYSSRAAYIASAIFNKNCLYYEMFSDWNIIEYIYKTKSFGQVGIVQNTLIKSTILKQTATICREKLPIDIWNI